MKATVNKFYEDVHFYIWIIFVPTSYFAAAAFFFTGL